MASRLPIDDGLTRARSGSKSGLGLLIIALAETVTLVVLLINLGIPAHNDELAAVVGPAHGALYLAGVLLSWLGPLPRWTKITAVVPVVGTWIAAVRTLALPPR